MMTTLSAWIEAITLGVMIVGAPLVLVHLRAVQYRRMRPRRRAALAGSELRHYTSRTVATVLDQGDGTVILTPRPGWRGGIAEAMHPNWRGLITRRRAVYLYNGEPTPRERDFHGHSNEATVIVDGAELLAHHPGPLHYSPLDSAIAVRGGYHGPGRVVTTSGGVSAAPAQRTATGWITSYVRALHVGR